MPTPTVYSVALGQVWTPAQWIDLAAGSLVVASGLAVTAVSVVAVEF
jgi:hypothetical protein